MCVVTEGVTVGMSGEEDGRRRLCLGIVSKHFCSAAQNADILTNHRGRVPQISEFKKY
jgi:hypothetical protein